MKDIMNFRKYLFSIVFLGLVLVTLAATANCKNSEGEVANDELAVIRNKNVVVVGSKESAEAVVKKMARTDKLWEHTRKGSVLMKEGRYFDAIAEYKEALKYAEYNYDLWVPKQHLIDAYEATGQYDNALIEIEELRKNALGEKVRTDLNKWESEIRQKKESQNQNEK